MALAHARRARVGAGAGGDGPAGRGGGRLARRAGRRAAHGPRRAAAHRDLRRGGARPRRRAHLRARGQGAPAPRLAGRRPRGARPAQRDLRQRDDRDGQRGQPRRLPRHHDRPLPARGHPHAARGRGAARLVRLRLSGGVGPVARGAARGASLARPLPPPRLRRAGARPLRLARAARAHAQSRSRSASPILRGSRSCSTRRWRAPSSPRWRASASPRARRGGSGRSRRSHPPSSASVGRARPQRGMLPPR